MSITSEAGADANHRSSSRPPERRTQTDRLRDALLFLVPVLGAFVAFLPVTGAYFHRDDFAHLIAVNNNPLRSIVWVPVTGHLYVFPKLAYSLLLGTFGPAPAPFFWFALILHLINTALLYSLARILTDSPRIASVAALVWGISRLHTENLSYFCLHANLLVGLGMLLALRGLAIAQLSQDYGVWRAIGWACLVFSASLSYGTGLVLALTFPLIAFLSFGGRLPRSLALPFLLLPVVLVLTYAAVRATMPTASLGDYRFEAGLHVSLEDPWPVLEIFGHLVLFALSTLGSIFPGLPGSYPSTAGVVIGSALALVLVSGCLLPSRRRAWIIALLFFAAACYAVTAVVPAFERQIFGQLASVKAQSNRYHYVPSIALVLALALTVSEYGRRLAVSSRAGGLACAVVYLLVLAAFASGERKLDLHERNRYEVAQLLKRVRRSAESAPPGSTVRIQDSLFRGGYWPSPSPLNSSGVFTLFVPSGDVLGRHLRYVEQSDRPEVPAAPGSPLARILVPETGS